ncbi:MAG: isoleucyl-tRNA synthetase, isoleucyl-tRNA synthetase [candidate division CPR1 bacterium GW2011_GWC1_49_13]|uniref:Isoleucine--tRNA ligase n=1 Tax=candidate division CPR1 bacterium GW2011_GWC1_49_13 TaxID=1618342 RepID=A0A0G1VGX5_9BACT|nr:MAG: isoleucyl-tRNA synthetase, isoleucyl-tRNA synthetase [candidate division CPR1 bacterium GW2011_GWC1_49_13]
MAFKKVDPQPDFPALEEKILTSWFGKKGILPRYLKKNSNSKKNYSFLDGPITANNPMGVHHAWGRSYKDLFQRFKNMQGFKQRFQNGFDAQGLWVEVEVEKELGLKSKKDIENLVPGDKKASIAKFVDLCKRRVAKYAAIQTEQSQRLGYFMDWDHSYYTLSDENNYMIWHFLKKCHEKGLIYKGRDSVPWCPRCGTAISQHEMLTEDYKEATHESVYMEYPIKGRKNEYLLVWTTTPWTLPGNVAIAVDDKKDYVAATGKIAGNTYYLGEKAALKLGLKVERKIKGKELVGLNYSSPFDHLPRVSQAFGKYEHAVVSTDEKILPISEEEGTGLVHIAPGAGTEDFKLGKKLGLPVVELIDEEASYLGELGEFSAQNAKKHPEIILDYLRGNEEFLFDIVPYTHRYPACWRCKTELVWRVVEEWYIAMDPLREPLKKIVKKIHWIPEFGLKRELDWLENMQDWLISKSRYWGLALPIWVCGDCGAFSVVGGKEELKKRSIEGWEKFEGHTPHRPYVDEVKVKCEECGGVMERISDVGNPWLDAGIVSFSTITKENQGKPLYLTNREEFEKWYPADFITESFPGQFKNWFYSLLAMSSVLENREPFKTVLGFATLFGENGEPMHKSAGNMIEFNEGAKKMGVDIMRWLYLTHDPAVNLNFGYGPAEKIRRRFFLIFWNVYRFFGDYALIDGWKVGKKKAFGAKLSLLDRWILAKLNSLVKLVTDSLERYDPATASQALERFVVSDLSQWYVRRSRGRVGPAVKEGTDKRNFYAVMEEVLIATVKLLAPFIPFATEEIYRNLTGEYSVHLADWPKGGKSDLSLEKSMEKLREIASLGHSYRKTNNLNLRQPLAKVTVSGFGGFQKDGKELTELLMEELNVKKVEFKAKGELAVDFDTKITPELKAEKAARDLIRAVQDLRKQENLKLTDKIFLTYPENSDNKLAVALFSDLIRRETLAVGLKPGTNLELRKRA